jgi:hypothetical protein
VTSGIRCRSTGAFRLISAALVMGGFFVTLNRAGWHPGARRAGQPAQPGLSPGHHGRLARHCRLPDRHRGRRPHRACIVWSVGALTKNFLLGGIAFSLAFSALLIYAPPLHGLFGTAALSPDQLATVTPFPFIVWGAECAACSSDDAAGQRTL